MDIRSWFLIIFMVIGLASASIPLDPINHPDSKPLSDLKEAIPKGLGFRLDEFKNSGFDCKDALIGQSVSYEFDIEIDNKVRPFKLLEDVSHWEFSELSVFRQGASDLSDNSLTEKRAEIVLPVLDMFQLAGPVELWNQDGKHMRLSWLNDVDVSV